MIVGLLVISTVTAYVRTTDRNITGAAARQDYTRKARFLGIALRRDIGEAGVGIQSMDDWGTVAVFGDTITVLKVPYDNPGPGQDPAYNIGLNPSSTTNATSNATTNCGNSCFRLRRTGSGVALTLQSGMVAAVTQSTVRRLIVINTVASGAASDSLAVTYRSTSTFLKRASIVQSTPLSGISNTNTTVQRLDLVAYWRDASNNLWRATRVNPSTGALQGELVASGCTAFTARLIFQDGTTATTADPTVAGHHYTNINGVIVTARFTSDIIDTRINGGVPLARTYTFRVTPRNLLYERNRGT